MRRASRGVAVVAARRHVDTAPGGLSVDRPRVDLDRVVNEDVVLRRDVEVFVAFAAGLGEVGRVDRRAFDRRRQNVVVTVAVRAMGHVLAGTEPRATVRLVIVGGLVVTDTAGLTADKERLFHFSVWHCAAFDMAVETLESVVHRMRDVVGKGRSVAAGLVAVGAGRAVDELVLVVLCSEQSGTGEATRDQQRCERNYRHGRPGIVADVGVSHISPGFVARAPRCRGQRGFRPRGPAGVPSAVRRWGSCAEVKARGGVDARASSTTSNDEIGHDPHRPGGLRRSMAPPSSLPLLGDEGHRRRRGA